jgi:hypothetical protein
VLNAVAQLHANDAAVCVEKYRARKWGILAARQKRRVVEEAQVAEGDGGEAFFVGAGVGDDGILRPVEIGLAEPASFGYKSGESGGRFIEDVGLGIGGGQIVESVD